VRAAQRLPVVGLKVDLALAANVVEVPPNRAEVVGPARQHFDHDFWGSTGRAGDLLDLRRRQVIAPART
jgi:hypothetical protein